MEYLYETEYKTESFNSDNGYIIGELNYTIHTLNDIDKTS
jgi:hypothetical protein